MKKAIFAIFQSTRFKLSAGAGFSQIVLIVFSPVLTRIYEPIAFGTYALATTLIGLATVISALRYETKIASVNAADAHRLLKVTWLIATTISIILFSTIGTYYYFFDEYTEVLTPGVIVCAALGNIFASVGMMWLYYRLGEKKISLVNTSRMTGAIAQVAIQVTFGLINPTVMGLLCGQLLGYLMSLYVLVRSENYSANQRYSIQGVIAVFVDVYIDGIKYIKKADYRACASGMVNGIGLSAPLFLIYSLYGPDVAGVYALCQRVAGVPISVLAMASANKFYIEISDALKEKSGRDKIYSLVLNDLKRNSTFGLFVALGAGIGGYLAMDSIFGEKWSSANIIMLILAPMLASRMAVVPVSQSLILLGHSGIQLKWDVLRVALVCLSIIVPHFFSLTVNTMYIIFSATSVVAYFFLAILILRKTRSVKDDDVS